MSGSMPMSTPINQIPIPDTRQNQKSEEDPIVSDVINEMEQEFTRQQAPPAYKPQPTPYQHTPMPMPMPQQRTQTQSFDSFYGINKKSAQTALIVSFVAFVFFYPVDTDFIYQKATILNKLAPYDRFIRALLLAIFLYILITKLNI